MQYYSHKNPPIKFKRDPSFINAFLAYMGGQYYQNFWDLCMFTYIQLIKDIVNGVSNSNCNEITQNNWLQQNLFQVLSSQLLKAYNHIPNILKEISLLYFSSLQQLQLKGNEIQSIQPLVKMHAPKLIQINLQENLITSIKSFKKTNFPCLRNIILKLNMINELTNLNELHCRELACIELESWINHPIQGENLQSLCRLQTDNLEWIIITNQSRIKKQKFLIFGKKWKNLSLSPFQVNRRRNHRINVPRPIYQQ